MKTRTVKRPTPPTGYVVWRQSTDYLYGWQWRTDDGKAKGEGYYSKTSATEAAIRHAQIETPAMNLTWTKGYLGVQHLGGHPSLDDRTYQVTIENYGSCTGWYVLALRGGHAFKPILEDTAPSPERAREAAEKAFLAIVGTP